MSYRNIFLCAILSGMFVLSGCDEKKANADDVAVKEQTQDNKQQEILKYNAYVEVSNYHPYLADLAKELEIQRDYMDKHIKNKAPLNSYHAVEKNNISGKRALLEKAVAIKVAIADIDASAEKFLQALKAAEPLNDELINYAKTSEYLTDNGKLFMEKEPQFVEKLEQVVAAEGEFEAQMTKHDQQLVKEQFDMAEKDSFEYYNYGIIYYEKAIVNRIGGLTAKIDEPELAQLEQDTNALSELLKGYAKINSKSTGTCIDDISSFISHSREMSHKMKVDGKKYIAINMETTIALLQTSAADRDFELLMRDFSSLIQSMNADRC